MAQDSDGAAMPPGSMEEQESDAAQAASNGLASTADAAAFPIEVPRPPPPPQPRVLTYPREMVVGQQLKIFGVPIAIFVLSCLLLLPLASSPCNGIFILALLGGVGYGCFHLYVFLRRFAVHPACPYCGKALSSDLTWVCGYCDTVHNQPYFYSVFLRCKRCGRKPKAYKCHYPVCGKVVYLDMDFDTTHCAYAPGQAPPKIRRIEDDFEETWVLEERSRHHAIKLASLEADYYDQMKRRATSHREFEKAKLPPPEPVNPARMEITRLLQRLDSRVAKHDALDEWHAAQKAGIKARKLAQEEENRKLKDLDSQIKHVKAQL